MTTHLFKDVKAKDIVTLTHPDMPSFSLSGEVILVDHDINYDYGIMIRGISMRFFGENGYVIENHEKYIEKPLEKTPLKFKHNGEWCVGVYNKFRDKFVGADIDGNNHVCPDQEKIEDWQYL